MNTLKICKKRVFEKPIARKILDMPSSDLFKTCETCNYYNTDRNDQPCCGCINKCNYDKNLEL